WDFLLTRAAANGRLIFTNDDAVAVKAPDFASAPVCTLQFGSTILEFDGEMDARRQFSAVKSFSWDAAQQGIVEKDAADPGVTEPGNLDGDTLAGVVGLEHLPLRH